MRHIITIILAAMLLSCSRITPEQEISSWLSTRADAPLAGTIWEHHTSDEFNRYLFFGSDDVSLFYGRVDFGVLHRWSEFFTAPYAFQGNLIRTSLSYRLWGKMEVTETASVLKGDGYTILLDDDVYEFIGTDVGDIFLGEWMYLYAGIAPWE